MSVKYNVKKEFKSEKEMLAFVAGVLFVNDSALDIVGYKVTIPPHTPPNRKFIAEKTWNLYLLDEDDTAKVRTVSGTTIPQAESGLIRPEPAEDKVMIQFDYPDGESFLEFAEVTDAEKRKIAAFLAAHEAEGNILGFYVGPPQKKPSSYKTISERLWNALGQTEKEGITRR